MQSDIACSGVVPSPQALGSGVGSATGTIVGGALGPGAKGEGVAEGTRLASPAKGDATTVKASTAFSSLSLSQAIRVMLTKRIPVAKRCRTRRERTFTVRVA